MHAGKTGLQEGIAKASMPYAKYRARPIWDSDADVILVLDACRYDLWMDTVAPDLQSWTESAYSVGSASVEWLNQTFADKYRESWQSAGYVTGNPHTAKDGGTQYNWRDASVYPLKERGLAYLDEVWRDQWDVDGIETVTPERMTERGIWAWNNRERYGMDTLVVHYMQPHIPFRNGEWTDGWKNTLAFGEPENNPNKKDTWRKLRDGDIPETEFWEAYADNLNWVLEEISRWQLAVDGKILITSDHGNAAGEWGQWGHPVASSNPVLRKVPWAMLETHGDGIEASPSGNPPVTDGVGDVETVNDRLEALGYK